LKIFRSEINSYGNPALAFLASDSSSAGRERDFHPVINFD
jgi:hypothetical protein